MLFENPSDSIFNYGPSRLALKTTVTHQRRATLPLKEYSNKFLRQCRANDAEKENIKKDSTFSPVFLLRKNRKNKFKKIVIEERKGKKCMTQPCETTKKHSENIFQVDPSRGRTPQGHLRIKTEEKFPQPLQQSHAIELKTQLNYPPTHKQNVLFVSASHFRKFRANSSQSYAQDSERMSKKVLGIQERINQKIEGQSMQNKGGHQKVSASRALQIFSKVFKKQCSQLLLSGKEKLSFKRTPKHAIINSKKMVLLDKEKERRKIASTRYPNGEKENVLKRKQPKTYLREQDFQLNGWEVEG